VRRHGLNRPPGNEPIAHWIAALEAGRRLGIRTVQCVGGSRSAARTTVVFADSLRAAPTPTGCFDPEEIWTLSGIEDKLEAAGITVVSHP
jgi:hypothetical protein